MENAVEALKIAFAVMMFAMALTLSMSSFSNAKLSIDNIIELKDTRTSYSYVEPDPNGELSRTVGIETIIPTLYSAYYENFKVIFLDKEKDVNGNNKPLYLYNVYAENDQLIGPTNEIDPEKEIHRN